MSSLCDSNPGECGPSECGPSERGPSDTKLTALPGGLPGYFAQFHALFNQHRQSVVPQTLPALFEAQAAATPDACALLFASEPEPGAAPKRAESETAEPNHAASEHAASEHAKLNHAELSYAELNRRANQLAHYLRSLGIGAEQVVGLALPRSLELMIGLLAILKTGAAYLPLDPNYPAARLDYMLADAKPVRVLTLSQLAPTLLANQPELAIVLDQFNGSHWPGHNLTDYDRLCPATPEQLAYLIYTSGSTGRPKGVMLTHLGIANLVANQRRQFAVTRDSRILQFASISFDAALAELALALCSGATLVLAPPERLMPGQALIELIQQTGVTVVTLPPSALAVMPPDSLPGVATLVVAGEACPQQLVAQWAGRCRMVNAYGPTEITVCATISAPLSGDTVPPLGQPMDNVQLYLLDPQQRPVAPGVPGELYLASPGLARGYLGLPELSQEKFIDNPLLPLLSPLSPFKSTLQDSSAADAPVLAARLYRTGDLASWQPDGSLHFLGRIDHQIKLRGFRVEPGEIEGALLRHPQVAQAAVLARPDANGQPQLIGWVVLRADATLADAPVAATPTTDVTLATNATLAAATPASILDWLRDQLPHYLVPAALLALPALPLSPNGKLDRSALPAPDWQALAQPAAAQVAQVAHAPQQQPEASSEHETRLTQLFCETLGLAQVAREASFFSMGGHSLSASRLLSRIRNSFGVTLSLDDVFRCPSVATLAALVASSATSSTANTPASHMAGSVAAPGTPRAEAAANTTAGRTRLPLRRRA